MSLSRVLENVFLRPTPPATRRAPKATLSADRLEDREVPAAFAFSAGTFTVNMAEVPRHVVTVQTRTDGVVVINGHATGTPGTVVVGAPGGLLRGDAVRRIVVNGSAFDDGIYLGGVTTAGFRGLDGKVEVYGNGGKDTIDGTAFDDQIHGGAGNDIVKGLGGNDKIWGDGDNDDLYGDGNSSYWDRNGGNDRIDGGAGNDNLWGAGGDDLLVGGSGADRFDGGVGWDVAWVDPSDPPFNPKPRGIEAVRTGTPPRV